MNQPTPSKPQHFDAEIEEWMNVLRDLRPSAVMRTETRVKPAVGAHWQARAFLEDEARHYARRWHEAGYTPQTWWQLGASLGLIAILEPDTIAKSARVRVEPQQYQRELCLSFAPADWVGWADLAAEHGPYRATLAMLTDAHLPLHTALFWAKHETRVGELQRGFPK